MFRTLKDLFDSFTAPAPGRGPSHSLELATAVLLVEVMRADPEVSPKESVAVLDALRRRFTMGEEALADLVVLAQQASRTASDFHQFTSVMNEQLDQPQKIRIVEQMWQVAYADGKLGDHENHIIARVAGLLHVTHGEYIAAKLRAKEAASL